MIRQETEFTEDSFLQRALRNHKQKKPTGDTVTELK